MKPISAGDRYGRLTAIALVRRGESGRQIWSFACDCGSKIEQLAKQVRNGHTMSCGCLRRETCAAQGRSGTKHGMHDTPEYNTWHSMRKRCADLSDKDYAGRGISVCDRWASFEAFFADMGPRPSLKHSIERENNDLGYTPDNCTWATKKQQARNRRGNKHVEYEGEKVTISEAAERSGVKMHTLWKRIKRGFPPQLLFAGNLRRPGVLPVTVERVR